MNAALLDVLACAVCGGRLAAAPPLLACRRCPARYPVLGGVPIVVPSPATYLASYRDAVLATLADLGLATRGAVAVVRAFAEAAGPAEPLAFGDDWVAREDARPAPATGDAAIASWLAAAPGPVHLAARVPARARVVVEVGCGAGQLARTLARPDRTVVAADLSLRAVLRATRGTRGAAILGAVLDAEHLALLPRAADAVIAANLVDLLEAPDAFLAAAARACRGPLVLCTPDPSLGTGDDDALGRALAAAGLAVTHHERGVPWLRAHSPRHYQLYFTDVAVAVSARGRDRGRDRSPGRARARARRSSS